jgi:hypothetical protein
MLYTFFICRPADIGSTFEVFSLRNLDDAAAQAAVLLRDDPVASGVEVWRGNLQVLARRRPAPPPTRAPNDDEQPD